MKYLGIIALFFSAGAFAGPANNNYQACINGNVPDVLNCAAQYLIDCEDESLNSNFSGLDCSNVPNPVVTPTACGVYMDKAGYMTVRDIVVESSGYIIPAVLFKESGYLNFTVIEFIDADGIKHTVK